MAIVPTNMDELRALEAAGATWVPGSGWTSPTFGGPIQQPYAPPPGASIPTPPIVTGIDAQAYEAILYGKEKPIFVGGKALLGGRPCEGIFWGGTQSDPTVSFIAFHAEAANISGTRTVTDARLRGKSVAYDGGGNLTDATLAGGRVEFRLGLDGQQPFQQSIDRYGDGAIAYRYGILSCWYNVPVKPFGGIVPMPSMEVSDSTFGDPADGITRKDAIEVILRYSRLVDEEFEVDVPGSDPAWIVGSKSTMMEFLQRLRAMFVHWNITCTDKLRIIDPTSVTVDVEITIANHAHNSMRFSKVDPLLIPRRKNYRYLDKDRDFEPNTVLAQENIYPAPMTSSVEESSVELPIVTTAAQATADVHVSLYEELAARSQMDATLLASLFEAEAGDSTRFADHAHIQYFGRIMETTHNFDSYTVDVRTVEILNCGAEAEEPEDVTHVRCYNAPLGVVPITTHEFEDADLGVADINRHSIICLSITLTEAGAGADIDVTVGGATPTEVALARHGNGLVSAIYHIATPTGELADIVLTTTGGEFNKLSIMVYRSVSAAFSLQDTATSTQTSSGPLSASADIPYPGFMIAAAATRFGATFIWTGITADCTHGAGSQRSAASYQPTSAQPGYTVSMDPSSLDHCTLAVATFNR